MEVHTGNGTVQRYQESSAGGFAWPSSQECKENPHRPDCKDRPQVPMADESSGYIDGFCNCHDFKEPMILANRTDIAWPAGFTQEMADAWRASNGLARPSDPSIAPS